MNLTKEKEGLGVYNINFLLNNSSLRIISSIFLVTLVVILNYLGSYYFLFLLILTFSILLIEYYRLFNLNYLKISFVINLTIILINLLFINDGFYLIAVLLTIFGVFIGIILNRNKWFVPVSSYFYLAIPFYILIYFNNHYLDGKLIILWLLSIVWVSDSSAYVFGSIIKGKKFFPSISPNKTWSGFIFSLIFSMISSIIFSFYFNTADFYKSMLVGLLIGVFTSFGDLF